MSGQLILGKDVANDNYVPISVDSSGHLDIDVQVADLVMKANDGNDGAGTDRTVKCAAQGQLITAVVGNTEADGSGTYEHLHTDGSGNLNTQIINTVSTNAFRTNIASGATNSHALVDAQGHVQVDVLSGGGGDATAANQTTINSSIGDTNSKIDAMRASDSLTTVKDSVVQNLTDGSAKVKLMGADVSNGQFQLRCDGDAHLQVDIVGNSDTTKATSTNQSTMITSLASLAGCVSGTELQVDIVSGGGGGGGGDASAANQTTMINHLSEIEGAVETIETCVSGTELQVDVITSALPSGAATEATLSAAEVHLGNIDTQTSSIQSNVATSALQTAGNATLVNVENNLSSIQSTVSSNRLQVNTNNATHGTLAQLSVATGATGANSAIINTEGYSKLTLVVKNSSNTNTSISASLHWSDSATFSGGTDLVMSSEDLSGAAFSPIFFSLATSADGSSYSAPQGLFSLSPPAQYARVNLFQSTGSSINFDFFYILSR